MPDLHNLGNHNLTLRCSDKRYVFRSLRQPIMILYAMMLCADSKKQDAISNSNTISLSTIPP